MIGDGTWWTCEPLFCSALLLPSTITACLPTKCQATARLRPAFYPAPPIHSPRCLLIASLSHPLLLLLPCSPLALLCSALLLCRALLHPLLHTPGLFSFIPRHHTASPYHLHLSLSRQRPARDKSLTRPPAPAQHNPDAPRAPHRLPAAHNITPISLLIPPPPPASST